MRGRCGENDFQQGSQRQRIAQNREREIRIVARSLCAECAVEFRWQMAESYARATSRIIFSPFGAKTAHTMDFLLERDILRFGLYFVSFGHKMRHFLEARRNVAEPIWRYPSRGTMKSQKGNRQVGCGIARYIFRIRCENSIHRQSGQAEALEFSSHLSPSHKTSSDTDVFRVAHSSAVSVRRLRSCAYPYSFRHFCVRICFCDYREWP